MKPSRKNIPAIDSNWLYKNDDSTIYTVESVSKGAGTMRGQLFINYVAPDGWLYCRTIEDFAERMMELPQ